MNITGRSFTTQADTDGTTIASNIEDNRARKLLGFPIGRWMNTTYYIIYSVIPILYNNIYIIYSCNNIYTQIKNRLLMYVWHVQYMCYIYV